MGVTKSSRLGLTQWEVGTDPLTRVQIESDNDQIELLAAIDLQVASINARPAAAIRGRYCWVMDVKRLYRDTGTTWVEIAGDQTLGSVISGSATIATGWQADATAKPLRAWWRNGSCTVAGAVVAATASPGTVAMPVPAGVPAAPDITATYTPAQVVAPKVTTQPDVRAYIYNGAVNLERVGGPNIAAGMTVVYSITYTY